MVDIEVLMATTCTVSEAMKRAVSSSHQQATPQFPKAGSVDSTAFCKSEGHTFDIEGELPGVMKR